MFYALRVLQKRHDFASLRKFSLTIDVLQPVESDNHRRELARGL